MLCLSNNRKTKTDCGIYAIAFAYLIANNTDPFIFCLDESN